MNEAEEYLELKVYKALSFLCPDAYFSLRGNPANEEDYLKALTWRSEGEPPSWSDIQAHLASDQG